MSHDNRPPLRRVRLRRAEMVALPLLGGLAVFLWTAPLRAERVLKRASFNDLRALSRRQPDNPRVFFYLGQRLKELGQLGPSSAAFARAALLDPDDEDSWIGWGTTAAAFGRKEEAFEALTRCARVFPQSPRAHLTLALFCFQNSALQRAHDEAVAAARCGPNDAAAWRLAGVTALELRDLPAADSALTTACRLDMRDWRALLALGQTQAEQGRPTDALSSFRKAYGLAPEEPGISLELGRTLLLLSRTEEELEAARSLLAKAASRNPPSFDALFSLGKALSRLRKWRDAREALERTVQIRPNSSAAHFELARACRQLGDGQAAERETAAHARLKTYEEERLNLGSRARTGNDPAVRLKLARLCAAHGDYRDAILAYRTLLSRSPGQAAAGRELAALERSHPEARPDTDIPPTVTSASPSASEPVLLQDAASMLSRGRHIEAERAYLQVVRAFPRSAKAFEGLGIALSRQSKTEDAFRALDGALQLDPRLPEAQFALARLYFDQGFVDEAARRMEILTKQVPSNPEYLHAFAVCILDDSSRYPLAEQILLHAVAIDGTKPSYWRDLAKTEVNLNRLDKAEAAFRKAVALAPASTGPAVNLAAFLLDHRPSSARQSEAESLLQGVESREPGNAEALLCLGRIALANGQAPLAVKRLQEAVSREPNSAQGWYHLARAYDRAGDPARAQDCRTAFADISTYRKELSETEERARYSLKDPALRLKLARLYSRGGQNARAINQYQVCLRLDPGLAAARSELASLASRLRSEGRLPSMNALNGMLLASVKGR